MSESQLVEILTACRDEERPPTEVELEELTGPFQLPAMMYVAALMGQDAELAAEIIASYETVGDLWLFLTAITGVLMSVFGEAEMDELSATQPYPPDFEPYICGGDCANCPMAEEVTEDEIVAMLVESGMDEASARALIAEAVAEAEDF